MLCGKKERSLKRYYDYAAFIADLRALAIGLKAERIDCVIAVSRGGLTFAHFLAMALDMRNVALIRAVSYSGREKLSAPQIQNAPDLSGVKYALIVDEIIDSGETMKAVLSALSDRYPATVFKTAALFQKPSASIRADFFARESDEWIDFFWEIDPTKSVIK
ncbi:MAG: phosphoribosyltransferase domain-containing protein [Helicobacteraceae bacterium]|jgi:xanthine phosphoribosyltransferase|nr:phosphoribosyltransferase domain-containing protein [Helicobacteraceae bacterium]